MTTFSRPRRVYKSHPRPKRSTPVTDIMRKYEGIEDPPKPRKPVVRGQRSKLGIVQFVATIFQVNETLPRTRKHTDTSINRMILEEFPARKGIQKGIRTGKMSASSYRYKYNTGILTGCEPPQISFRYNEDGHRVDQRTGKRLLSPDEQKTIIEKFRQKSRELAATRATRLAERRQKYANSKPQPNGEPP